MVTKIKINKLINKDDEVHCYFERLVPSTNNTQQYQTCLLTQQIPAICVAM